MNTGIILGCPIVIRSFQVSKFKGDYYLSINVGPGIRISLQSVFHVLCIPLLLLNKNNIINVEFKVRHSPEGLIRLPYLLLCEGKFVVLRSTLFGLRTFI